MHCIVIEYDDGTVAVNGPYESVDRAALGLAAIAIAEARDEEDAIVRTDDSGENAKVVHRDDYHGDNWAIELYVREMSRPTAVCLGCGGSGLVRTSPDDADTCVSCDGTGVRP